ncbi:MAG TPA: Na+/H+ antiporter subunit B [Candidatus Sulfomarinibacteraceae bacterium]|nr:Na+/H+ antiporter subunit B [Candidatus Sulfomarinibacteraceae bacterium]
MTDSLILRTAARLLLVLMLVLAVFVLLRGHNDPGGGFIGGLLAAGGVAIYQLACGVERARRLLRVEPRALAGIGVLTALAAGLAGLAGRGALLAGLWWERPVPGLGKLGTPLLFDLGVFLVVVGSVLTILFTLDEEAVR